jgi:hypothetical protein
MAAVEAEVLVGASLAETWDYFFEPRGWPGWVDGFESVEDSNGYPERGGTLRWRSTAAGRGTVTERVLEHAPRTRHRIDFADPETEGELTTTFALEGHGTRVKQELDYQLRHKTLFSGITDLFFIRSQQQGALQRSLAALKHEVEELSELGSAGAETSR